MTIAAQVSTPASQPEWEALAAALASQSNSLSALGTAFTWGSILLGLVAIFGAFQWRQQVRIEARAEAREEARAAAEEETRRVAQPFIDKWMTEKVPVMIRELHEMQRLGTPTVSVDLADQIAQNVNSEPEGK